jgi:hypothetical protein
MEKQFFGLTTKDVKRMAFQLAIKNEISNPFSGKEKKARWKWFHKFMRRHSQLSLRKPQPTSATRVKGFTPGKDHIYEHLLEKIHFTPHRLYNCDETGLSVVQHKVCNEVSLKGTRQIAALSSAERGSLVIVVTCMSAAGHFVPPLLVYPRINMKAEVIDGDPPDTTAACHKSGLIQIESFTQWFQHFLGHVKPKKDDPVVLVLDGHFYHTRNIQLLDLARENGVHIVRLPPHCTHKMQPLDVSFMLPFKTYYAQKIVSWLRMNPTRVVTHYQIASLLGKAY